MKAFPIRSAVATRRLPTPKVTTEHTIQPVDLKPQGNTIALRTSAQNPFTEGRAISVRTQASGGMSPAPRSMQSRRLMHSFMPGLGEDPNAANQGTPATAGSDWGTKLLTAGQSYLESIKSEEQAKAALATLEAEKLRAEASQDRRRAAEAQARMDSLIAMMGGRQGAMNTSKVLMFGGLAVLAGAGYLMLRNKKAGRRITGRKRRTSRRR